MALQQSVMGEDYCDPSTALPPIVNARLRHLGIERQFLYDANLETRFIEQERTFKNVAVVNTRDVRFYTTSTLVLFDDKEAQRAVAEMRELGFEDEVIGDWLHEIGEAYKDWAGGPRDRAFNDKETAIFVPPDAVVDPTRFQLDEKTAVYCLGAGIPFGQSVMTIYKFYDLLVMHMLGQTREDLKASERPFYFAYHVTKDSTMYLLIV